MLHGLATTILWHYFITKYCQCQVNVVTIFVIYGLFTMPNIFSRNGNTIFQSIKPVYQEIS